MSLSRRSALAALALSTALGFSSQAAFAQNAEKPKLTLGVGGKQLLYYLPLTVAEKKGYFKEQGLDVEINDFGGGAKSLQALVGGSVEQSNTDIADEFSKMIVTQQAYSANTKVITTAQEMLRDVFGIIR